MKKYSMALLGAAFSCALAISPSYASDKIDPANHTQAVPAKVNLNTATIQQLTNLPGVGEKKAKAIVDYRKQHGGFTTLDDLTKVKGIGDKMLGKFKSQITI